MSRLIDADAIPYTMLYKENWLKGTGVEKPGVWKDTIDAMPTVEPERKKGHWNRYYKMHTGDTFCCSRCGSCFIVIQGSKLMNYCPNCMSDNREVSR